VNTIVAFSTNVDPYPQFFPGKQTLDSISLVYGPGDEVVEGQQGMATT
jgi:hypothetical protein